MIYKNSICFGVAGNFANHLEQAGESADFVDVVVHDANAPKGIFPTFIPNNTTFIGTCPFSNHLIFMPDGDSIQMEPEVALKCSLTYNDDGYIKDIKPLKFMAYNDCSIRKEGAKKISHKKNWGEKTKGISFDEIDIDKFSRGGIMDNYSLISFIIRDNELIQYGENSELLGYSYFYQELLDWINEKLNYQEDIGPLENLHKLIIDANKPEEMVISIGATRYTDFGENNYLEKKDKVYVITYDHTKYTIQDIKDMILNDNFSKDYISILKQIVE